MLRYQVLDDLPNDFNVDNPVLCAHRLHDGVDVLNEKEILLVAQPAIMALDSGNCEALEQGNVLVPAIVVMNGE
ncbi:hypothetical protein BJX70DRAFT_358527 [Aspergillus crustosus]